MVKTARDYQDLHDHYRRMFDEVLAECPELLLVECDDVNEFQAFAVSCYSAARFLADLRCEWAPGARMEDLTGDVDRLAWFCEYVTRLPYDREKLASYIETGPINRHRESRAGKQPQEVYESWQSWQRDVAELLLPGELLDRLTAAGYDVSMLCGKRQTAPASGRSDEPRAPACLADFVGLPLDEAPPPEAPVEVPVLVEAGYRGFNVVHYTGRFIAAAQSLGPVDLTQVDEAWLAERRADARAFVGETLGDVKRQIDQIAADEMASRLAQLQEQLSRLTDRQLGTESAVNEILTHSRLQAEKRPPLERISAAGWRVCRQVLSQLRKSASSVHAETSEAP
jgi:hypothetical protein